MKEIFTIQSGEQMTIDVSERLVTNFNGSTILRGTSGGRDLVVKFSSYPQGAQREWDALRRVQGAGIPSQVPVAFIPGDRPGLITEHVPGEFLLERPEPSLRYSLGILIRNMHQSVRIDGSEWQEHGKKDFSFYDKKIEAWESNHIGGNAVAILKELGKRVGDSFRIVNPVFIHNDLHDKQVITNEGELTLIDFEFWREAHPMGDLAKFYIWVLCDYPKQQKIFLDSYSKYIELPDNFNDVLKFYTLRELLGMADFFTIIKDEKMKKKTIDSLKELINEKGKLYDLFAEN